MSCKIHDTHSAVCIDCERAPVLDPAAYAGLTKIPAIKRLREQFGQHMPLAGAKAIVDSWEAQGKWTDPRTAACANPCAHCSQKKS